jgi:hypothetical protein
MAWCPECKTEYGEGFTKCHECGAGLVDVMNPAAEPEPHFGEEAFLMTVPDKVQADVVESLLNSFEIPVAREYQEAGSYVRVFTGTTSFGIDLFVPSKALDKAKEIVRGSAAGEEAPLPEEDVGTDYGEDGRTMKNSLIRWFILLVLILPPLIGMIVIMVRDVLRTMD